jgi:hypothetical protein
VTIDWTRAPLVEKKKLKLKLIFDCSDTRLNKGKRCAGGAHGAESAYGGSLKSGGQFCVGAFVRNLASIAVNIFFLIFSLVYKEMLYMLYFQCHLQW